MWFPFQTRQPKQFYTEPHHFARRSLVRRNFTGAASLCEAVSLTAVELPQPPRQLAAKALDVVGAVDLRLTRKHRFLTACRGTRDVVARQSHAKRTLCGGLRGAHKHVLQEVPSRHAAFRRHEWDRIVFRGEVLRKIARIRSLLKSSGRLQRRPDCFSGGSIRRNAKNPVVPHLAIIIL